MKRLCIFYCKADQHLCKHIDWIVCKECVRKLAKGTTLISVLPNVRSKGKVRAKKLRQGEQPQ